MNSEFLLAHFSRISNAPDAIPRLRSFIRDLAVRGKLVEQYPNDEPAFTLVERIQAKKACLFKEGKIKQFGPQRKISASEIDYPLPRNWEPIRIGDLLTVIRGASPRPKGDPKYFSSERTPYHWIKISDIRKHSKERVLCDTDEFLTQAGMEKSVLLPKGTLVVTNSATIGVPIFVGFEGGCIHDGYLAFPYFPTELSKDFFFLLFQTLQSYAAKKARGMAQLNLNTELVREFPLGLPPFAEQRRIVAKVDELMALCDRLEAIQRERETRRDRLTAASLYHLNNGADANAFRQNARFYLNHLFHLSTSVEHIQQLRQTVLNLAVRGQLVGQDPNDDSVPERLERILAKREQLRNASKSNTREPLSSIHRADEPFSIPAAWRWTRLGNLVQSMTNGIYKPSSFYSETGTPCVRMYNIQNGRLDLSKLQHLELTQREIEQYRLEAKDILVNRVNSRELVGKAGIVDDPREPLVFEAMNIRLRLIEKEHLADYVNIVLRTNRIRVEFQGDAKQAVGQASMSQPQVANIKVPLPPFAEQHRIVAKVDELMSLCDRLEAQLTTTRVDGRRLLEAVLYQALSPELTKTDKPPALPPGPLIGGVIESRRKFSKPAPSS